MDTTTRILSKSALDSLLSKKESNQVHYFGKKSNFKNIEQPLNDHHDYDEIPLNEDQGAENSDESGEEGDDEEDEEMHDEEDEENDFLHPVKDNLQSEELLSSNLDDYDKHDSIDDYDDNDDDDDDKIVHHHHKKKKPHSNWSKKVKSSHNPSNPSVSYSSDLDPHIRSGSDGSGSMKLDDMMGGIRSSNADKSSNVLMSMDAGLRNRLPGPPRELKAHIVKARFITLSWLEPLKNPTDIVSYTIYYKMNNSER